MRKSGILPRVMTCIALVAMINSCRKSDDSGDSDGTTSSVTESAIIGTFIDDVAIATYTDLVAKSTALNAAAVALKAQPTEANFQAARAAWIASRVPWEQSEGFLFGPVDTYSLDPALDSWPLDYAGIDAAIAQYASAGTVDLDSEVVDVKGFHAIEFILYGEGNSKTLATQTNNERSYLVALTANHKSVSERILTGWNDGLEGGKAFGEVLRTAGESSNDIYPTTSDAIQELVDRMVGIADEVGETKIGEPFESQDPNKVESQYSYNSLADFQDNIRSIRHVYEGGRTGTAAANSLSAKVAAKDAALNQKVEDAIDTALDSVKAIPEPFRDSITNSAHATKIVAAQDALAALSVLLNGDLRKALK